MDQCPMCKGDGRYVNSFSQPRRCGTCKGTGQVESAEKIMNSLLGEPITLADAKLLIASDVQDRHGVATQLARDEYTRALGDLRKGISWTLLDDTAIKYNLESHIIRHSR